MKRTLLTFCTGLVPTLASMFVYAADLQSLDSIRASAKTFIANQYKGNSDAEVSTGKIDPRLRMAKCSQPIETSNSTRSQRGGNVTVKVSCNGTKPWSLYVPVKVKLMQEVVILSNSLPRNTLISEADIRLEKRDVNQLRSGYFNNPKEVVGKLLKHSTTSGLALNPHQIKTTQLVKRGQQVTLMAETNGISVKISGEAMSNGSEGERIKVKNLSSNRLIEGTITKEGVVLVSM